MHCLRSARGPESVPAELGALYRQYRGALANLQLTDRAGLLRTAIDVARESALPPLGVPLCAYDLSQKTRLERVLLEVLAARAPHSFATFSTHDVWGTALSSLFCGAPSASLDRSGDLLTSPPALRRLQSQLFSSREVPGDADESVAILSAPGESRESVEVARRILAEAARGVPFDRMAILLRSPFHYRTHLLEALRRAGIPAHFTRGASTARPKQARTAADRRLRVKTVR